MGFLTRTHIADWDDGQCQVSRHFGGNNSAKTKIKLAMLKEYLLGKNSLKAHKKEVGLKEEILIFISTTLK